MANPTILDGTIPNDLRGLGFALPVGPFPGPVPVQVSMTENNGSNPSIGGSGLTEPPYPDHVAAPTGPGETLSGHGL